MYSDERVFERFHAELEKLADSHTLLGNVGAMGGAGALLGAGGGALVGGVRAYRRARDQGATVAEGFGQGLGGALHGAGRGALVGGVAGAAVGAATPRAVHERLSQMAGPVGAGARFGQRQVHAVSGWLPKAGDPKSLEAIRGGAYSARKTLGKTEQELVRARFKGESGGALRSAERSVERARAGLGGAEQAQAMGLTSIPGYVHSFREAPLKTVRTGLAEQWRSGGVGAKALTVGLPALGAVNAIRAPESATGPGKGERVGRELAATAGNLAAAPLPFIPGQVVGAAFGRAGGLVGRGVDRLRGRRPTPFQHAPEPENVSGQHVASERLPSSTAVGQMGEVGA